MTEPKIPQAMLAARVHDPLEKTLILMRTKEGHEGGTSKELLNRFFPDGVPGEIKQAMHRADHWASAADRAAFPKHDKDSRYPSWQNVRFVEQPVLIHPLTGESFALDKLSSDISAEAAKTVGLDHLRALIHTQDGQNDLRRTALAFWRFGPDLQATGGADKLRNLWALLPADTRVLDHTIHDHLDLTAAFAASFAADLEGGPALLAVSIGPVQGFIAAARSTSDLWAGSHLLSRISWEAMKVLCEEIGPEAILFPRLRGVPQVDLWLREECGLRPELFEHERWTEKHTDENPLFAAALPNRFTALVPASRVQELADIITCRVREWVKAQTKTAFRKLLDAAGEHDVPELPGYAQIETQLEGFPEVHWAAVPWSLVNTNVDGKVDANNRRLVDAMRPFFADAGKDPGYLGSTAWKLLSGNIKLDDGWFYKPNPGALYPALYELLERVLAAAKSTRTFNQNRQEGWRDSLTGESEWLTTDRNQLALSPGQRKNTLWSKFKGRYGIKKGEHLDALGTLKRLWPTLFVEELEAVLDGSMSRFVVSTHAMAITGAMQTWLKSGNEIPAAVRQDILSSQSTRIAMPRKLVREVRNHPDSDVLLRLPGWAEDKNDESNDNEDNTFSSRVRCALGQRPETYYGLLMMDGDRMGAWISADPDLACEVNASFHPQIRQGGDSRFGHDANFAQYANEKAAATPSRHMAISDALNHFAMHLAPYVVEYCHAGRVLYAGGDDVMAMLPVDDLLPAMAALRAVYSGVEPADIGLANKTLDIKKQANGFVFHRGHLLRLMGKKATASCGAVVAHHKAPLAAVLRAAREAESVAKKSGGRDAFCLTVVERSGGTFQVTAKWGEPVRALLALMAWLQKEGISRRAIYHSVDLLKDLPRDNPDLITALLTEQFIRKGGERGEVGKLVGDLVAVAFNLGLRPKDEDSLEWLAGALSVAVFLVREQRAGTLSSGNNQKEAV